MSVGPLGIAASAAGISLAQSKSTDVDAAQQATTGQSRQADSAASAEAAAGVGSTNEDQQADERDADGRRLWEEEAKRKTALDQIKSNAADRKSIDTSQTAGTRLDLTG